METLVIFAYATDSQIRAWPVKHSASTAARQLGLFGTSGVDVLHRSHVTFSGGVEEPGHLWYSYLEGYSPEFVRHTHQRFMPSAKRVIDPFAGTGTTPLTLGLMGVSAAYCEINPVLRRVVDAKVAVSALPAARRRTLSDSLNMLSNGLSQVLASCAPDTLLAESYPAAFGCSTFFDSDTLDAVLRFRAFTDALLRSDRLLGELLQVAVMSRLVTCSLLQRAGDVRFKTPKELARGIPPLVGAVSTQLVQMAADVCLIPYCPTRPLLLGTNAKALVDVASYEAEGVITSPPYLNGTNYIRNTKLELWFLRALRSLDDLRFLRDQVVTSGINDVVAGTGAGTMHRSVAEVVEELRSKAYDMRLLKMVAGYFADMTQVLQGLAHHTIPGAVVCIDIGDSRYAGVSVPTPRLLSVVAETVGFSTREIVPLRKRYSKDKTELSQDLIVLERTKPRGLTRGKSRTPNRGILGRARWEAFKEQLPHTHYPFTKRNWGHPLHSVCSYSGKLKPALAHALVHAFSDPGDVVLDPFSGSGTIPFEAALGGRSALGMDIATLPVAVSNAKLMRADARKVATIIRHLEEHLKGGQVTSEDIQLATAVRFNGAIPDYFHERTFGEVISARRYFLDRRDDSPEWALVMACMLHILHGNRPYALSRRSHPITPYKPTGAAEYKSVVVKLRDKVARSLSVEYPDGFREGACLLGDVLGFWPEQIREVATVITSPPFFDSTRFYMANWMRYWFAGWERTDFDEQPAHFVETKQRQSFDLYAALLTQAHDRLRAGGTVVFHLGLSKKCDMASRILEVLPSGFEVVDSFSESVEHCESHGIKDKGSVTKHQFLVLQKS